MSLRQLYQSLAIIVIVFATTSAFAKDSSGVVVTHRPIHSIAAYVMQGISQPHLLFNGNQSSHKPQLKPSQIRTLSAAKIVFRISENLETGVERAKHIFSKTEFDTPLIQENGLNLLPLREVHEPHSHDDHVNSEVPSLFDPHIWLDLQNAVIIAKAMAEELSDLDPKNKMDYQQNAVNFAKEAKQISREIEAAFKSLKSKKYISFHDAFQYFEKRFGLERYASILPDPNRSASAAHLRKLQNQITEHSIACILTEPQISQKLVHALKLPPETKIVSADPLGQNIEPGSQLYFQLIRNLATAFKTCLG